MATDGDFLMAMDNLEPLADGRLAFPDAEMLVGGVRQ
jgi:hypothetical protein